MTQELTFRFGLGATKGGFTRLGGMSGHAHWVAKALTCVEQGSYSMPARFKVQYECVARQISELSDLRRKNMNEVAR